MQIYDKYLFIYIYISIYQTLYVYDMGISNEIHEPDAVYIVLILSECT